MYHYDGSVLLSQWVMSNEIVFNDLVYILLVNQPRLMSLYTWWTSVLGKCSAHRDWSLIIIIVLSIVTTWLQQLLYITIECNFNIHFIKTNIIEYHSSQINCSTFSNWCWLIIILIFPDALILIWKLINQFE